MTFSLEPGDRSSLLALPLQACWRKTGASKEKKNLLKEHLQKLAAFQLQGLV